MQCPKCGAANDAGAVKCAQCGEAFAASAPPVNVAPPPMAGAQSPPPQSAAPMAPLQNSGMAVAALVLGILGFCTVGLTAIAGLILGIVALSQIKASDGRLGGSGIATGGIVTSSIALGLIVPMAIMASILFPVFAKAREKARQTTCMSNQRQIATGILMYVQDNNGKFPDGKTWVTELASIYGVTGTVWDCPSTEAKGMEADPDYAYNALLALKNFEKIQEPAELVTVTEPLTGDLINSVDDIDNTRHSGGFIAGYADGHIEYHKAEMPIQLQP